MDLIFWEADFASLSPSAVRCISPKIWSGGDKTGRWTCRDSMVDANRWNIKFWGLKSWGKSGNPQVTILLFQYKKIYSNELGDLG